MAQLIEKLDQKGKVTGPQQSVSQSFLQATVRHQKCPLKAELHVGKSGELQQPQIRNSVCLMYQYQVNSCTLHFVLSTLWGFFVLLN